MDFEWNDGKAARNSVKHGVVFAVAARVFRDPDCVDFDATRAGDGEMRRKAVGMVSGRLLTTVYTKRAEIVRIISARQANTMEKRRYADD